MSTAVEQVVVAHPYQDEDVILVPYTEKAFDEAFLVQIYMQAKMDGTLARVFPSGEGSHWSLNQFIYSLHTKPVVVGLAKPDYNVVGLAFLYEVDGQAGMRKASLGFLFLKNWWGKQQVRSLARLAFKYWKQEMGVQVLYGTILTSNRLAQNFAKKFGFQKVGSIPGFFCKDTQMVDGELFVLDMRESQDAVRNEG